jgi:uncharacterized protein (TIRG00374 family)
MEAQSQAGKVNWRTLLTVVTFVALAILIYSLRKDIGGVIKNLGEVHAVALLLMIPFEAWNYDSYARFYINIFRTLGEKVRYWPMYRLNLELNFINHILPSGGVSGISYFNIRMRSHGVSGAKSAISQVMKLFLLYASFQPLLIVGLFLLALRDHANNLVIMVASTLITLLVVGSLVVIYIIESRSRINTALTFATRILNWLINLVRRKHPETIKIENAQATFIELHENYQLLKSKWRELKRPFIFMMLANITELGSLYCVYIAFGHFVNLGAVIIAYAVANFAGLISVLPAGIGIYEGLMTAVLAATGIPAELSIPVTIMYRVLNMLIQLTPGYILYQKAVSQGLGKKI